MRKEEVEMLMEAGDRRKVLKNRRQEAGSFSGVQWPEKLVETGRFLLAHPQTWRAQGRILSCSLVYRRSDFLNVTFFTQTKLRVKSLTLESLQFLAVANLQKKNSQSDKIQQIRIKIILISLADTALYADLLVAPAEGFFWHFGQKKSLL